MVWRWECEGINKHHIPFEVKKSHDGVEMKMQKNQQIMQKINIMSTLFKTKKGCDGAKMKM